MSEGLNCIICEEVGLQKIIQLMISEYLDVHTHAEMVVANLAAEGGVTTLVDMPLINFLSTVSRKTLELKLKAVESRIYVDVGFWGGLVPENAFNKSALEDLLQAGVLGLKSFMRPSLHQGSMTFL